MAAVTSIEVKGIEPSECFEVFLESLSKALLRSDLDFEPGKNGFFSEENKKFGRVRSWVEGSEVVLDWQHDDFASTIKIDFAKHEDGTRISLSWDRMMDGDTAIGWFAEALAAPFLVASSSKNYGDWLTDRMARRPSGRGARSTYGDPLYHKPNFLAILAELHLTKDDYLLEVGCGGGFFLSWALKTGCKAAAIDHSDDMVALAKEKNAAAIQEGRLEIRQADAQSLPFPDSIFTCAVSTGVFGFISDPLRAMSEVYRTLEHGGRFLIFTGSKAMKGTIAAPEPVASRARFYEDQELVGLARRAGFEEARVDHPDMSGYAREVGVPEDAVGFFGSNVGGGQLLVTRKS